MMIVWYVLIGLGAGVLAGTFGIGGGIVSVPALMLLAKMPPQRASATSRAVFLLPVGALGVWQYYKEGRVDLQAAAFVAAGLIVGAFFGAKIGLALAPRVLQRSFAVLLVLVAIRMWWKA